MATESRSYVISGELAPGQWDTLLKQLGRIGVVGESLRPDSDEASEEGESCPEVLLDKQDFHRFADKNGISRSTSGKAWYALAIIHQAIKQPFKYKDINYHECLSEIPLIFEEYSSLSYYADYAESLRGLHLSSLEDFLRLIRENKKVVELIASNRNFSMRLGPKALEFLDSLVAAKRAEIEAGQG